MLLIMLLVTTSYASVATVVIPAISKQPVILVIGDSLSSGYGIDPEKSWVSLLRHRLKQNSFPHQLVNASISGDTTGNGLKRLPGLLTEYQPDFVIIELGGNDGLRGLSLSTMKSNLAAIINLSQKARAKVLLTGIRIPPNYGKTYTRAFYAIYPSLADQFKIPLIPFLLANVGDQVQLMQNDGIHPTAAAQPMILDTVWPYIKALINT